ncbi:MAG TPA: biotin--[acetyl-CoA-carboxylase] ligase [Gammaproteobacteria bacterium]|nr:biotin--[acetyl-CoA-carboxylase] ligase [Gammaproteobacteria bacterium]
MPQFITHGGQTFSMPTTLLDEAVIRKQIQTPHTVAIDILPRVTSTIDWLKAKGAGLVCPHICLAEEQTHGRGQMNRYWHTPFATNVNLSCAWLFQKEIQQLEGLSLVVGICVVRALAAYGLTKHVRVKWPNDIYWKNNKLAGILVDTESRGLGKTFAIISVGLNVNMVPTFEDKISQAWTSLSLILGNPQDRSKMAGLIIDQLLTDLEVFDKQTFAAFVTDWQRHDYLREKSVTLKNAQGTFSGVAKGIDGRGHLLIRTDDGALMSHASGELVKREFEVKKV